MAEKSYSRIRALFRSDHIHSEIDSEMQFHIDMQAEENVRRGMDAGAARRDAERRFGKRTRMKEEGYDVRGGRWLEILWQDFRYGARSLKKSPGFTAAALLTLALGIGANTAIFSVVQAVLLRTLPYRNAGRVVLMWENNRPGNHPRNVVNPANFLDWRSQSKSFEEMAAFVDIRYNLTGEGPPEEVPAQAATPNLFQLLGVDAFKGRTFTPEEFKDGRKDLVIISYSLWQRRFGESQDIIGRKITLNGTERTVIGVMPPDFNWFIKENSLSGKPAEIWVAMVLNEQQASRGGRYLSAVGRIAPGISIQQAQSEMTNIGARLESEYADFDKGWGVTLVPLREQLAGAIRPALLVLFGAVGFVLLIACVNVANLLLARAEKRNKELAVRAALGAGRIRIIRQLLTESIVLAVLGGVFGLLLARWCLQVLLALSPPGLLGSEQVSLDVRVLVFTLVLSLATGFVFGIMPAIQASRLNLSDALKKSTRGDFGGMRGRRLRDALVIIEIGLALILLAGAGLMIKSFSRLQAVNPGFETKNLLTMRVMLPGSKYENDTKIIDFFRRAVGQVSAISGVVSASAVSALPFADMGAATDFTIEGKPEPTAGDKPSTDVRVADENYFRTMNIPIKSGRVFTESESVNDRKVVLINESFARKYFPGEEPIGKRITVDMLAVNTPTEIIGVVGDARYSKLEDELKPMVYWPPSRLAYSAMTLVIRTSGKPEDFSSAAIREIHGLDKDQPVSDVRSMESWVAESVSRARFGTFLLSVFAAVALALAAIGIYGVMSYSVLRRRSEIGVRIALGAQARDVLQLVIRHGMTLVLAGIAMGLVGALALTRLMTTLLYQTSTTDLPTFAMIAFVLTLVSLLACYIPARRATHVDPIIALRDE